MTKEFALKVWGDFVNDQELAEKFSVRDRLSDFLQDGNKVADKFPKKYRIDKADENLLSDALIGAETAGECNGFVEGLLYASYILAEVLKE